jgi:hypothetical protein
MVGIEFNNLFESFKRGISADMAIFIDFKMDGFPMEGSSGMKIEAGENMFNLDSGFCFQCPFGAEIQMRMD